VIPFPSLDKQSVFETVLGVRLETNVVRAPATVMIFAYVLHKCFLTSCRWCLETIYLVMDLGLWTTWYTGTSFDSFRYWHKTSRSWSQIHFWRFYSIATIIRCCLNNTIVISEHGGWGSMLNDLVIDSKRGKIYIADASIFRKVSSSIQFYDIDQPCVLPFHFRVQLSSSTTSKHNELWEF